MDDSAVNFNVTVDDFDSILNYPDQAAWTTPDPSSSSFSAAGSSWLMGTYHKTEEINASVSLNFTGVYIILVCSSLAVLNVLHQDLLYLYTEVQDLTMAPTRSN